MARGVQRRRKSSKSRQYQHRRAIGTSAPTTRAIAQDTCRGLPLVTNGFYRVVNIERSPNTQTKVRIEREYQVLESNTPAITHQLHRVWVNGFAVCLRFVERGHYSVSFGCSARVPRLLLADRFLTLYDGTWPQPGGVWLPRLPSGLSPMRVWIGQEE